MTSKKIFFDLNNVPKWHEMNWIEFEITISMDAIKKLVKSQPEMLNKIKNDLHQRIELCKKENSDLDELSLYQFIEQDYGLEERTVSELSRIINLGVIATILSVFESKLKIICNKLISDFNQRYPNKGNKNSQRIILKYWKLIKKFISENEKIEKCQNSYNYISKFYTLRNVLIHQNFEPNENQYKELKGLINIDRFPNKKYLITTIEIDIIDDLIKEINNFFDVLLDLLKEKTNLILSNT